MRNYGVPQFVDLVPDGASSITPGTSPTLVEFLFQAPKSGVGDSWPIGTNYIIAADVTVDQAASGGSAIEWENWFVSAFDSFNVDVPLLGTTHTRDTYQAAIAKHVIEFVSSGYTYTEGARAQILSTDGDTLITVYQVLPMAHECNDRPHHSGFWLGWLNAAKIQAWMATSTAVAAYSTGAVIKAPTTVRGWVEYIVSDELIMPVVNQWHRYTAPAAGQTTHFLTGIGTANGLNDVKDGSRLVGLFEMMSQGESGGVNMGGATSANHYTSMNIPQLSQDQTVNVDAYFAAYRRVIGGHRGPISYGPTSLPIVAADGRGNPYNIAGSQTGHLNSAGAWYIPIRAPGRNFQLSKQPKFFGDLKRSITLDTTVNTGNYVWVTNEFRELGESKKAEMIAKTGRAGTLERILTNPQGGQHNRTSLKNKAPGKGREAVLPQRVMFG